MHIPDGFVSVPINGVSAAVSAAAIGFSLWRVRQETQDKRFVVPLLAVTAAFVFAAQMLNFPISGGTSGHFLGGVTAAALLGPWASCVVLTLVLVIQGFLFADGGITALGTNILNMGIVGGILGYAVMRGIRFFLPAGRGGYLGAAAIASWFSIVLAATACAIELALSGTSPLGIALPAMAGVHAIIGIGEALITVAVLTAVIAARPDIIPEWAKIGIEPARMPKRIWALAAAGLALSVILALFVSPFASQSPDGLEKVAEEKGFIDRAAEEDAALWRWSPFPDYSLKGVESEGVSTGVAGLIGTVLVFVTGFIAIKIIMRRRQRCGESQME